MIENIARRVGFGFRPDESLPTDPAQWIEEQLDLDAEYAGVRVAASSSPIETWPADFKLPLKEIYKRSFEYNRLYDQYTKKASQYSIQELLDIRRTWMHENEVFWRDETRLFHSAIYGTEQVRQRLIHFWANHFTVGDGAHERKFIAHHIEDAIGGNLKGKFNELLYEAVRSPAMIHYLDNNFNFGEKSAVANAEKRKPANKRKQFGLNDNLAREILELHTITPDAGYSEEDIRNVAKILAGWGLDDGHRGSLPFNLKYGLLYEGKKSEPGKKVVFGQEYKKGKGDLRDLTDYLADHIKTAEHLSYKLCQHFIADQPSDQDVKRVLDVWTKTKGDLPSVHREVLLIAINSDQPKFQWPLTWLLQSLRVSGASLIDGWEEVRADSDGRSHGFMGKPRPITMELGQGFWLKRQPNGYSQVKEDWISPAHLERRVRFSKAIYDFGNVQVPVEDLVKRFGFDDSLKGKVLSMDDPSDRFVMFACAQRFVEA